MEDLDALLEDLEASIPPPITCGPKPGTGKNDEIILNMQSDINDKLPTVDSANNMPTLQGNLSELDVLLQDLYSTDEPPDDSLPSAKIEQNGKRSSPKNENDSIDNILQELNDVEIDVKNTDLVPVKEPTPVPPVVKKESSSITISEATQQLDELMLSLAGFGDEKPEDAEPNGDTKPQEVGSKPEAVAKEQAAKTVPQHPATDIFRPLPMPPNPNDLDVMLQDMSSVLKQQGIAFNSKGVCDACKKPVMGEVTTALGKVWHPEHFVCAVCDQEIGSKTFFEREGKPYCESCYQKLFSPLCAYCKKPVLGQCVTALNDTWHPEHFFCAHCNNYFGDEGFHEHDGKPYCRADFYNLFAPHCRSCEKPILSNYISALNAQWHPECFVCGECLAPFTHGSFFELGGRPYCETHYHSLRGSLCADCKRPITGRCITAMGKKFHPEHFICAFCLKPLNKGTFKDHKDKPYCHQCYNKLFVSTAMAAQQVV